MDLADFVKTTLQEILKGVREAQAQEPGTKRNRKHGIINPGHVMYQADHAPKGKYYATTGSTLIHFVQFDVAVTTEAGDNMAAGGKISVLGIGVGSEDSVSSRDTTASRIKFEVPVTLPESDE